MKALILSTILLITATAYALPPNTTTIINDPYLTALAMPKEQPTALQGEFTAYNTNDDFTPSTIMANGEAVHSGAIACPSRYAFNTKISVNGKIYLCKDRMARRYRQNEYFDIYTDSKAEALAFGRKTLEYAIIE